tara:strand:- start:233 stop:442 length:210 start_codon:yes stop_codon:yes gene_type:complete
MRTLTKVVFFSKASFLFIYHVLKRRQLKKMRRLAISPYIYREIKKERQRELVAEGGYFSETLKESVYLK